MNRIKIIIKDTEELITSIRKSLENAPKGHLRISSDRGKPRFFIKADGTGSFKGTYIPSSGIQLAKELAQKEYDTEALKIIEEELHVLEKAFEYVNCNPLLSLFNRLPESRKKLIDPHFITDDEYASYWLNRNVRKKPVSNDNLNNLVTENGEYVRSKSEMLIANKLFMEGIPYRYEQEFRFDELDKPVYPDFTVLNKRTRQIYILEHFGMLDKSEYLFNTLRKLQTYSRNGLYYGVNFLFTFETGTIPLDMQFLDRLIKTFLK